MRDKKKWGHTKPTALNKLLSHELWLWLTAKVWMTHTEQNREQEWEENGENAFYRSTTFSGLLPFIEMRWDLMWLWGGAYVLLSLKSHRIEHFWQMHDTSFLYEQYTLRRLLLSFHFYVCRWHGYAICVCARFHSKYFVPNKKNAI